MRILKSTCFKLTMVITLVFLLVFSSFATTTYAESSDSEPPTLINCNILGEGRSFNAGDSIILSFDTTDNLSGVSHIMVEWKLEGTDGKGPNHLVKEFSDIQTNHFEEAYTIPEHLKSGNWTVSAIQVWDTYSNLTTYSPDTALLSNLNFTVNPNPNEDIGPPVLESIEIAKNKGSVNDSYFVKAKATDDTSQLVNVQLSYTLGALSNSEQSFSLDYNEATDYYEGNIIFSDCDGPITQNTALLKYITLWDDCYYSSYYANESRHEYLNTLYGIDCIDLDTNLDITFTDIESTTDTTPPELLSFDWQESELITPCTSTLIIEATDDISGIGSIEISSSDGIIMFMGCCTKQVGNKYYFTYEYGKYAPSTTRTVSSIKLIDNKGNESLYSLCGDLIIEEKSQTITNNIILDLFTSTRDVDLLTKISALKEGSTAVIDVTSNSIITKEVFDAIKNKNITLIFEKSFDSTYEAQNIEWIINGKDIVNATKNIDVNIFVSKEYDKTWLNYQEEKHGTQMPGMAGDNGPDINTDEAWDEFTRNELRANGWGDVIETIEKNRKENQTFMDSMSDTAIKTYLKINFEDNGLLPGKSTIRLNIKYATRNIIGLEDLNLYYYDSDNEDWILLSEDVNAGDDGSYEFTLTHNSIYNLASYDHNDLLNYTASDESVTTEAKSENSELANLTASKSSETSSLKVADSQLPTSPKTGDNTFVLYLIILVSLLSMASILVKKNK